MAKAFTYLLVAVASMATVYCVVASSGNAWANEIGAVADVPAELMRWHSGVTGTSDSCVKSEWKSTLNATDRDDSTEYLVMHGAVGPLDVTEHGSDYSVDSFDAPKGARKVARHRAGIRAGSPEIAP